MSKKLDKFYKKPDPWGYKTNKHDANRKKIIIERLEIYKPFKRAIDLGCGEGWITADLPADEIWGWDISSVALSRVPSKVITPNKLSELRGIYDLIIMTGVLYDFYDFNPLLEAVRQHANRIVLTCHIADKEIDKISSISKQIYIEEFPYRKFIERLRIFEVIR